MYLKKKKNSKFVSDFSVFKIFINLYLKNSKENTYKEQIYIYYTRSDQFLRRFC